MCQSGSFPEKKGHEEIGGQTLLSIVLQKMSITNKQQPGPHASSPRYALLRRQECHSVLPVLVSLPGTSCTSPPQWACAPLILATPRRLAFLPALLRDYRIPQCFLELSYSTSIVPLNCASISHPKLFSVKGTNAFIFNLKTKTLNIETGFA